MADNNIKHLDDGSFAATVDSGLVLVDFWAPWCSPCLMQGPILEEVANSAKEKITIAKVDVDQASRVATQYGIRSIPTLILFKDGQAVEQWVGVQRAATLLAAINQHV